MPVGFKGSQNLARVFSLASHFADGFEPDPRGAQGPIDEEKMAGDDADGDMDGYSVNIEAEALVVQGTLRSGSWSDRTFHRRWFVHLRRQKGDGGEARSDVADLLLTRRGVSVCFVSREGCPEVVDIGGGPGEVAPDDGVIFRAARPQYLAREARLRVKPVVIGRGPDRDPAMREVMRDLRRAMLTEAVEDYPDGTVGFLESNYVARRLARRLPKGMTETPVSALSGLSREVPKSLQGLSAGAFMVLETAEIARRGGVSIEEAVRLRTRVRKAAMQGSDRPEAQQPR